MIKRGSTRKELKGRVSMARWHGTGGQGWRLSIEDETSHLTVCEVQLTDEQVGQMLGGSGPEVAVSYWANPDIGKALEHGRVLAELTTDDFPRFGMPEELMKDLERTRKREIYTAQAAQGFPTSDGWEAEVPDRYNGHRQVDGGYEVQVRRYVDVTP